MENCDRHPYEFAKENVLSNELLTRWLVELEERLRRLEALSPSVTLEVSQDELAETGRENEE